MVAGLANKNRGVCDAVVVKVGRGYFSRILVTRISAFLFMAV